MPMRVIRGLGGLPAGRVGKWVVLLGWLAAAVVFTALAGRLGEVMDNDETNWLPRGTESTRAAELARREFPTAKTMPLAVIYTRDGRLTPADRAAVEADRAALASLSATTVAPPQIARDRTAMLLTVPVDADKAEDTDYVETLVGKARAEISAGLPAGLTATTTGPAASRADAAEANGEMDGVLAGITVGTVIVMLLITYRGVALPFAALLCVFLAAVLAQGAAYLLGEYAGMVISGSGSFLLTVLTFGVGTDYALLLVSRYREELRRHPDRHAAMAVALRRTTPSVAASAATVVLTALALLAASMNSTRGLGTVAAAAVAAAMLAMTTLLPAVLVIFGRWLFWPRIPRHAPDGPPVTAETTAHAPGAWPRLGRLLTARPRGIWVGTALALVALTACASALRLGGLTAADNFTREPESVTGQKLVNAHFPAGTTSPTDIYVSRHAAPAVATAARATPGVAAVQPAEPSLNGRWARVRVVLSDPPAGQAAQRTVDRLRREVHNVDRTALVGGPAATSLDTDRAMNRDLRVLVPIILVIVVVMLGLLLRALVAPLLLLGCVLLSFGGALGLSALVFHAAGFPRANQTVIVLGFMFLVALGADYTIFLMGRAREEVARLGHRPGMVRALVATGGVITSAGIVLAATFAVFTATPVVLNIQLGTLVAVGVLIDTFIVRSLLVPALALDVGPRVWWPSRLPRRDTATSAVPAPPLETR